MGLSDGRVLGSSCKHATSRVVALLMCLMVLFVVVGLDCPLPLISNGVHNFLTGLSEEPTALGHGAIPSDLVRKCLR